MVTAKFGSVTVTVIQGYNLIIFFNWPADYVVLPTWSFMEQVARTSSEIILPSS